MNCKRCFLKLDLPDYGELFGCFRRLDEMKFDTSIPEARRKELISILNDFDGVLQVIESTNYNTIWQVKDED